MLIKTPSWRADHVRELLDTQTLPDGRFDDKKTIQAYKFFKEFLDADDKRHIKLERSFPQFTGAVELYTRTDMGFRWYIEAAILANVPTDIISEDIGLPLNVINTYEELYFDIRKFLSKRDYVLSMVFFPSYRAGLHGRDFDTLWKMIAYYGSFDMVREFTACGELTDSTKEWLTKTTEAKFTKNAFTAAQIITPNQYNASEIIDSYINLLKIDRGNETDSELTKTLASLFGSIEFTVNDLTLKNSNAPIKEPRFLDVNVPANVPLVESTTA